jgi:hypothetical protein
MMLIGKGSRVTLKSPEGDDCLAMRDPYTNQEASGVYCPASLMAISKSV